MGNPRLVGLPIFYKYLFYSIMPAFIHCATSASTSLAAVSASTSYSWVSNSTRLFLSNSLPWMLFQR